MRFRDQAAKVVRRAELGIDGEVIFNGIRTAERAFAQFFADGMNGHQPENIHAEIFQFVEAGRDAVEVAAGGKGARIDFVNDAVAHPGRRGAGRLCGEVLAGTGETREQNERQKEEAARGSAKQV
jgi:hypothetical protein